MSGGRRVLVTGADGLLGTYLREHCESHPAVGRKPIDIIWTDVKQLDITDEDGVRAFLEKNPADVILNLAAYTDVDGCEDRQDLAFRVNANGPATLAKVCAERDAWLIQISTDFVFAGDGGAPYREEDHPSPLSVYGKSKLAGEQAVRDILPDRHTIVRTAWLYGRGAEKFINKIIKLAQERPKLQIVYDQVGSPTYAADLAGHLWSLVQAPLPGTFHVAGKGGCSRYEMALHAFKVLGIDTPVEPIDSSRYSRKARVPADATLDCSKFEGATGRRVRPWQEALEDYLINDFPLARGS